MTMAKFLPPAIVLCLKTFRVHDNPLLSRAQEGSLVVLFVDARRLPRKDPYKERLDSRAWSIPQAWLLLHAVEGHARDLARLGFRVKILVSTNVTADVKKLASVSPVAIVDLAHDPAFDNVYSACKASFRDIAYVETCTLVDWSDVEHASTLDAAFATPFAKTTSLKSYIRAHVVPPLPSPARATRHRQGKGRSQAPSGVTILRKFTSELAKLAKRHRIDLYPVKRLLRCVSLDDSVIELAARQAQKVKAKTWHKPSTARDVGLLEHPADSLLDTSKMSPFLSLGMLSARTFYGMVRSKSHKMGSADDQLLFRECWYVAAIQDEWTHVKFWTNIPNKWWKKRRGTTPQGATTWDRQSEALSSWIHGDMHAEWIDANESMHELFHTGWLHHLRRHLVADVLCSDAVVKSSHPSLGRRLGMHFVNGEAWFRRTLVDHDAVLNRANWMWLSASAFSTKQMAHHYSPIDYVRRNAARSTATATRATC